MDSVLNEQTETEDLAARFQTVIEASFKRIGEKRLVPGGNKIFAELTLNQLRGLHILMRSPGMAQKELAECLEITPAAVSTAVNRMEKLGLVERRSDLTDARQKRLYLSEFGERIFRENQEMRNHGIKNLLGALTLDEQRMIVEILERAVMRQQESEATGPPRTGF
jgi:DNA-binding MarR family transcriptional regulator